MSSRMITARMRREKALRSLLRELREETVQGVGERLAACVDEGDDLEAGVDCLLRAVERLVAADTDELTGAERRHLRTLDRVDTLRRERDEAARDLRRTLVELRKTAALLFGREAGNRLLRVAGPTARAHSPHRLVHQARDVLNGLVSPDAELPKSQVSGSKTEEALRAMQREWVESLETGLARLQDTAERLEAERHRTDGTRSAKDDRIHLHDQELSAIANLQEALLVLGGKPESARTVWQKQRPVGRPPRRKKRKATRRKEVKGRKGGRKEVTG